MTPTRIGEIIARARAEFEKIGVGQVLTQAPDRADLIDLLSQALPYVEEAQNDPAHKPVPVRDLARKIRKVIEND
jgi:hypothetical protein